MGDWHFDTDPIVRKNSMTMPHLMNCDHSADGWCLACVKRLYEEKCEIEAICARWERTLESTVQVLQPIAHNRHVKAMGYLEIPAHTRMLIAEVGQLRDAIKISHQTQC